jgi:hypothetical protein
LQYLRSNVTTTTVIHQRRPLLGPPPLASSPSPF